MRKNVIISIFLCLLILCSCAPSVEESYDPVGAPIFENKQVFESEILTDENNENIKEAVLLTFSKSEPLFGEEYATLRLPRRPEEVGFVETLMEVAFGEPAEAEDKYGVTKYGTFFGTPTYEWCTEFALWCVIQAQDLVEGQYIDVYYPYEDWSGGCVSWYKKQNLFFTRESGYVPRRGDMMFFDYDSDGSTDHTGLVTGVEYDTAEDKFYVLTIEGNLPEDYPVGKIVQRRLALDWEKIYGYGALLFCENKDVQCVIDY
ncbi:MAG: CHAP domain-containing protein [Clostridia bacterium]|nr:CHAP domain-containing protein [Clostridia bacterium]